MSLQATCNIVMGLKDASLEKNELRAVFAEADSAIPFNVLANYLAGAQIALMQWWLEKRQPHTPENLAQTFHRLQRAAIRDVFGIRDGE
jgi:Transcriptional regulator C-terminal region